jgi:hypothetical protein
LTVNAHVTTLGKDASVATVKIDAVWGWEPPAAGELLLHPAANTNGKKSKRVWTHFHLFISVSFFANPAN